MNRSCYIAILGLVICTVAPASARNTLASAGRAYRDADEPCFGGENAGSVTNSCTGTPRWWEVPLATDAQNDKSAWVSFMSINGGQPISCTMVTNFLDNSCMVIGSSVTNAYYGATDYEKISAKRPCSAMNFNTYVGCYMGYGSTLYTIYAFNQ